LGGQSAAAPSHAAYLAGSRTAEALISDAGLDWRSDERIRFIADNVIEALSPSNNPLLSPAAWKAGIETGGQNYVRGARPSSATWPPRTSAADGSSRRVRGGPRPCRHAGAVVLRTEHFELIHYAPQTTTVRTVPLLLVPR